MANKKFHIKKGDTVVVISGEYKGKEGRVLKVIPKKNKAIVEGINIVKKHLKHNPNDPKKGGIIEMEAPIHISNLMLVYNGTASRIGRKKVNGKTIRYLKKTGEEIK